MLKKLFISIMLVFLLGLEVLVKAGNVSPFLFQILFNKNIELKNAQTDSVNILLLGIGGGSHDCPNCSDTIIFTNLNLKTKKITLVSLPRDMWIDELSGRINSAYEKGEAKRKGGGLTLAESVVDKVTGQEIDYGVVIDFSGFVKTVDLLGGIDINVDRTLDDYEYPIEGKENDLCGHDPADVTAFVATDSASLTAEKDQQEYFSCRYEHIHFDKGQNHMDGETALKYVRSRHAEGTEGTDFARSQRQEKVIKALMDKTFSLQIITNPSKVIDLYSTLQNSIRTDIPQNQFDDFIKLAEKFKQAQVKSSVIDYGDPANNRPGLLINPPISSKYNYEWILIPRVGENNFSEIQSYVTCEITVGSCQISPTP